LPVIRRVHLKEATSLNALDELKEKNKKLRKNAHQVTTEEENLRDALTQALQDLKRQKMETERLQNQNAVLETQNALLTEAGGMLRLRLLFTEDGWSRTKREPKQVKDTLAALRESLKHAAPTPTAESSYPKPLIFIS